MSGIEVLQLVLSFVLLALVIIVYVVGKNAHHFGAPFTQLTFFLWLGLRASLVLWCAHTFGALYGNTEATNAALFWSVVFFIPELILLGPGWAIKNKYHTVQHHGH